MISRNRKLVYGILFGIFVTIFNMTLANASSASHKWDTSNNLTYKVKGTITVRPDRAIIPLTLSTKHKSYVKALTNTYAVYDNLKLKIKNLDNKVFSFSPGNFLKQDKHRKKYSSLSFFSNEKSDEAGASLSIYLIISFNKEHTFKQRANFVALAYDFTNEYILKQNNDSKTTNIQAQNIQYVIDNVESYREAIVKKLYQRAKLMVDIVAKQENAISFIHNVDFKQDILQDISHFNKATLTINAIFKFGIKHKKLKESGKAPAYN